MSTDNPLSLVGEIMDCYEKAELADACALRCALDCGKNLNEAMEAVGKGKWKKWREQYLPKVSEETERVYRRLAKAVAKKEDVFCGCISIRDAIKHLSGLDENLQPKPERKTPSSRRTGSSAAALGAARTRQLFRLRGRTGKRCR